ncbi:unnamed protein product, partial [Mesorhabditis belari]|uniref:Transmembrane protein 170A n=1 Tax=Mesorhabditis belari TaxID=2138241 RepID=A0AAF3FEN7_9BILA
MNNGTLPIGLGNPEKVDHISLFENVKNPTKWIYNVYDVLSVNTDVQIEEWQHIFFSILIWMTISYLVAYLTAILIATIMLRKHPFVVCIVLPMSLMCVVGPVTMGAVTSASIAFALSSANKPVNPAYCLVLGVIQTFFHILISFSRILATL